MATEVRLRGAGDGAQGKLSVLQDRKERDSLAEVGQSNFLHLQEGSCPEERKWSAGESFPVGHEASVTFYHLDSRGISSRELEARGRSPGSETLAPWA